MAIEIETHLFPVPNNPYAIGTLQDKRLPLSLFALNLHIVTSAGNLLKNEAKKGHYFFRDGMIPRPRPATILAWDRVVRLGIPGSPYFMTPFLPALREEDEIGSSISDRGVKVPSLSRRSNLHVKDSEGRIIWGSLYMGQLAPDANEDSILVSEMNRGNFVEALLCPRKYQQAESSQNSVRDRMEALASYGLLGVSSVCKEIHIPWVTRLLFQCLSQRVAAEWALQYNRVWALVASDPHCIESDFKELCNELIARGKSATDSDDSEARKGKRKNIPANARFGDINEIEF